MVADSREKPLVKVMPWWVYVCLYGYAGKVWESAERSPVYAPWLHRSRLLRKNLSFHGV